MARQLIPIFIFFLTLSACGPSISLYSDLDESAPFDQYTTYSFVDFSEGNKKTITGMELERIRVAFAKEVESRGLHFAEKDGDVSIKITVYHRQAASRSGYYGVYNYMERAISVDMYDNHSKMHVWHCAAVGELENDPQQRAAGLQDLAAKIFGRYPIQSTEAI